MINFSSQNKKKLNVLSAVAGMLSVLLPHYIRHPIIGLICGIIGVFSALNKWNIENGWLGLIWSIIGLICFF